MGIPLADLNAEAIAEMPTLYAWYLAQITEARRLGDMARAIQYADAMEARGFYLLAREV